ncbi:MAG TPA: AAA family ATPase, partial [Gemmatimonadaceae bacterium]|nr:AAA family ATPase [Gemmatimonadaceae bacterium]
MIFLHTLGVAVIHVGVRHVLPSASRGFGSLLYLALEPGRAIPRDELQSLLFPKHGRDAGAHSLRQLIYRMRHLGAPIVAHADSVSIPPELVRTDFAQVHEAGSRSPQFLEAAGRGFLPGYSPSFSQPYSDWLDAQRVRIMHDVRRGLLDQLGQFRVLGRWRDLEPIARACLAIDPLNDEATLALAESLALGGQKAGAVQLLDSYLEEIGHYPTQLRTSAHALRTRIHEHVPEPSFRRIGPGPFVGRDEEMAELWRHYHRAKHSEASVVLIYGEPGIGKTRLATEFLKAAALDGATCVKVECAPHDVRRPLGVFVDLVPKLLDAPGGLGVAPEAMAFLQRLTHSPVDAPAPLAQAEPTFLSAFAARAITEAVDAVSAEQTLVLAIDDGHHIDSASATIIGALASHHVARAVLILVTTRHRVGHLLDSCDTLHSLRVRRLLPENALALLERLSSHPSERFDPAQLAQALAFANGNP